jgi:hypothetical protein
MYCAWCHRNLDLEDDTVEVRLELFHAHCYEAALRRALDTSCVLVLQLRRMLAH